MALGQRQLKPGAETVLKAVYNTQGRPGPYEKSIYLFTNSSTQPRNMITLKGEVKPSRVARIKIEPRKIHLGNIRKGAIQKIQFQINNDGDQDLQLKKIRGRSAAPFFKDKPGATMIHPKDTVSLDLEFVRNTIGQFVEVIFFDTNAHNALNGNYAVMVTGECIP